MTGAHLNDSSLHLGHGPRHGELVSAVHRRNAFAKDLRVLSPTPPSKGTDHDGYLQRLSQTPRWSEAVGCDRTLIATDTRLVDPWLVSQTVIENTEPLCPLVALQPLYMYPYSAAKIVASLAFMHGRRVCLKIAAAKFTTDTSSSARRGAVVAGARSQKSRALREPKRRTGRYYAVSH